MRFVPDDAVITEDEPYEIVQRRQFAEIGVRRIAHLGPPLDEDLARQIALTQ